MDSDRSKIYLSEDLVTGLGKMWFLQVFHQADTSAGRDLLGSVLKREGGFGVRYPQPLHFARAGVVLDAMNRNRDTLHIPADEKLAQKTVLSGMHLNIGLRATCMFQSGLGYTAGPVAEARVAFNYDSLTSFSYGFKAGDAYVEYIPTNNMCKLYKWCEGNYRVVFPDIKDVDDQYLVDQVLIAKNPFMNLSLSDEFSVELKGAISYMNASLDGQVKYTLTSNKSLKIEVLNNWEYLIAFKTIDWDDLG